MLKTSPVPGSNGDRYIPFDRRTGDTSVVYFTRDLSAQGLVNIFRRVGGVLTGNVAVKVHTGEQHGPNIIPRSWVKALMEQELPGGTIVETNTYYDGDRYTTEKHRKTLQVNGWTCLLYTSLGQFLLHIAIDGVGGDQGDIRLDGRIESGERYRHYMDGITPAIGDLIEQMDQRCV